MIKTGDTPAMGPEEMASLIRLAEEQAQIVFKKYRSSARWSGS